MILFGANDACLHGSEQHVPLEIYKDNLRRIMKHVTVQSQNPRLILVTPPPVNEYAIEVSDAAKGIVGRRTAEHTMAYVEACRQVGEDLGVGVIDLWGWCMAKAKHKLGDPLPGSKKTERNGFLDEVLSDGKRSLYQAEVPIFEHY